MGLFTDRKQENGKTQVPVWFMRQAGRYHDHYQNIKKNSDFMTMCRNPELACEVTMGPIDEFDFDAAILFSDLLFPLEQLNLGLSYRNGPPELERHLKDPSTLEQLKVIKPATEFYKFQADALTLLKEKLPPSKTLLGFVGAPFTLYTYATEGSHSGNLVESKKGLYDGRFEQFMELLLPELLKEMTIQAEGGADAVCIFDTAAGELSLTDYKQFIVPRINHITREFKKAYPNKKIVYYSKFTHLHYLHALEDKNIDVLGIDWRNDLVQTLKEFGNDYYVQGNFDPCWLHLEWPQLEQNLMSWWDGIASADINLDKWICGLGHGVIIKTPQDNVQKTIQLIHDKFRY